VMTRNRVGVGEGGKEKCGTEKKAGKRGEKRGKEGKKEGGE